MPSKTRLIPFFILIALAGFACGSDFGVIGFAIPRLRACLGASDGQIGALLAGGTIGGLMACLGGGIMAGWAGRKKTILLGAACLGAASLLTAMAAGTGQLLIGRTLQGASAGLICVAAPMLAAESLPGKMRGLGISFFQLSSTLGLLMSMGAASWMTARSAAQPAGTAESAAMDDHAWRMLFACALAPAALLACALAAVRESPSWFFQQGRRAPAIRSLLQFRKEAEARRVYQEMNLLAKQEKSAAIGEKTSALACLRHRHFRRPFILVMVLFAIQNTVGVNAVLVFPAMLLEPTGMSPSAAANGTVWFAAAVFGATMLNLILVDRIGRQPLLRGGLLLAIGALAAGAAIHWRIEHHALAASAQSGRWMLACLVAYGIGIGVGPCGCIWLLTAELLPTRVRALGMGVGTVLAALATMLSQCCFLPFTGQFGMSAMLAVWGLCAVVYLAFACFFLPETKGKTLEEIELTFA